MYGPPLRQPLLAGLDVGVPGVEEAVVLVGGLPQVHQGQDHRQEDDEQGPQQQGHHDPLRGGLVAPQVAAGLPLCVLGWEDVVLVVEGGLHRGGGGHHRHACLGDEQLAEHRIILALVRGSRVQGLLK